jgi:hypothetical protein
MAVDAREVNIENHDRTLPSDIYSEQLVQRHRP